MNLAVKQEQDLQTILDGLHNELIYKKDLELRPKILRMDEDTARIVTPNQTDGYRMTDWALAQLAGRLNIDTRYLRRCPAMVQAYNVNYWLNQKRDDTKWLVRTMDKPGQSMVRGFLSDKYSPFDDHEMLSILTGIFGSATNYRIQMWHRDDTGFHLRVLLPDLTTVIGTTADGSPDRHIVALHIENSEVGKKSIKVRPLIYRMVCTNGMFGWAADGEILQQRHVHLNHNEMYGRVATAIGEGLRVGDSMMEHLLQAKETKLADDPLDVLRQLAKNKKYSQDTTDHLQEAYYEEPGATPFHIVQAFTRAAQRYDADTRVEMERDAGQVMRSLITV